MPARVPLHSPAKDLYRRMDRLLGDLHARVRGREFLEQALHALFDAHARELGASGAQLYAHDARLLERVASVGRLDGIATAPLALAEFHDRLDAAGHRVQLVADDSHAREPLAFFEVAHETKPFVFLFQLDPGFERGAAELVLNTACSILSVRLAEERLGAVLREAAEIQRSLLPQRPPEFPGFDLAARSVPADEVGGDWFDWLPMGVAGGGGEGSLGIAIGDASGHGLPAALMARDVVVGLRMGIEKELKAGHALEKLNRVLHASTLSSCFASLLYGELEDSGSFFYYNAGHDAPLLASADGCALLRTGGTVLGPLPEARFRRHFAHLDHGAVLALYTDGLIEHRSRAGELFGLERLRALVQSHRALPAGELVARVFEAVDRFGAGGGAPDDRTLVVVRRLE
jgi:sigma-B regulation protein RsbU (phosphoserine phosphatase)